MSSTFRFLVAYDGGAYSGFQSQAHGRTVEDQLKEALMAITGQGVSFKVAGRTDAGVHARGQTLSVHLPTNIAPRNLCLALLTKLPADIAVWRIDKMPDSFDARRHSIGKHYIYRLDQGLVPAIDWRSRAWHVKGRLDIEAMKKAAAYLVGEHDFSSFRSSLCEAAHAIRFIWEVSIKDCAPLIEIHIKGNAFCLNMVRIITGTLVEVGRGRRAPDDLKNILAAKNRNMAGITAKAHGLTLEQVYYPDNLSGASIPHDAVFPRFPINSSTWPVLAEEISYGSS